MTTLITLFGLAIGILIFMNLLHAKAKLEGVDLTVEDEDSPIYLLKKRGKSKVLENAPHRRVCPICKTTLLQEEYLLCAMQPETNNKERRQVHIYGCPHCFLSKGVNLNSSNSEEQIKSLQV